MNSTESNRPSPAIRQPSSCATSPFQAPAKSPKVLEAEDRFVTFPRRAITEEFKCQQGIPLSVEIPEGSDFCPYLGERRGSFYDLLKKQVLFRLKTRGLKEGTASVYGPSVCDAKYGCRCGYRHRLVELRSEAAKAHEEEHEACGASDAVSAPKPEADPEAAFSKELRA